MWAPRSSAGRQASRSASMRRRRYASPRADAGAGAPALPVLQPGAGVEDDDAIGGGDRSARPQRFERGVGGATFGADVEAGAGGEARGGGEGVGFGDGDGIAAGLAQRAQADEAADRRGHAQAPYAGPRVGPGHGDVGALEE